ncbi:aldo/keto reductase [Enterovibrio norvegicus]|uniref:Aldo/keto reductase n=1 Tax=Enterovibrio norvegicus TaxID=188144 RepID=A0A2N7L8N2_9GAMM|nr:aldo/keto reductase [Enterovibrio norvegicus]PMN90671.1 aldo/keto reductase [Enterovibrio norvegicus]
MKYRHFKKANLQVSEIGYGMWGIAGGEGGWNDIDSSLQDKCLDHAVKLGCNFFDTAWIYGRGYSEQLLGRLIRRHPEKKLVVATKVPPKNREYPSKRTDDIQDIFPNDHIIEFVDKSLSNIGVDSIDLLQFHVWEDSWAQQKDWQECVKALKEKGLVKQMGISVNRWEPTNVIETLKTGLIDCVQVIYNVFDQAPEDELFDVCQQLGIAVIARVPFDEGSLTGNLTLNPDWPEDDWRHSYFVEENLKNSVERAERLRADLPEGCNMPTMALKFILHHPAVTTVIPGMRQIKHVEANLGVSDLEPLSDKELSMLREHRWDREPTWWSQ